MARVALVDFCDFHMAKPPRGIIETTILAKRSIKRDPMS